MTSMVIVALPTQDDYIWQVSSEKVPHMTLLFLGDVDKVENAQAVFDFVEHASKLMQPFYMESDYRGELGTDKADVLFFEQNYDFKHVETFRNQLLQNQAIKKAYDSTEQFAEWTPHITLGYPETPAKTPDRDRTIYSVQFDRIAVWTGDSTGPEFRLKHEPFRYDQAVSMSSADADVLLHYGVKGMRWGLHTRNKSAENFVRVGDSPKATKQAIVDAKWLKSDVRKGGLAMSKTDRKVFSAAQKSLKPEMKTLNNKAEYRGRAAKKELTSPGSALYKKHEQEHTDLFVKHMKLAAEKHLDPSKKDITSPSGNWKRSLSIGKDGTWQVGIKRTDSLKHADEPFEVNVTVQPKRDTDGLIIGYSIVGETLKQGASFVEDELSLMHYGVKGMHWGQRMADYKASIAKKEEETQAARREKFSPKDVKVKSSLTEKGARRVKTSGGEHHDLHSDAVIAKTHKQKAAKSGLDALSNKELQQLATRMNLEQQVTRLSASETKPGKNFVHELLLKAGKKKINDLANDPKDVEKLIGLATKK